MLKLSDISKIKEIVDLLNEYFIPEKGVKKFLAYFPTKDEYKAWHICCSEYFLIHSDREFDEIKDMICKRYGIKLLFCYLHDTSMRVMIKNKMRVFVK